MLGGTAGMPQCSYQERVRNQKKRSFWTMRIKHLRFVVTGTDSSKETQCGKNATYRNREIVAPAPKDHWLVDFEFMKVT